MLNESAYERIKQIRQNMEARKYMAHELTPSWMEGTRQYLLALEKRDLLRIMAIRTEYKGRRSWNI